MSNSEKLARRQRNRLRAFAREIIDSFLEYRTPDLGEMQDLLLAHGLIVEVEATGSCGEGCICYNTGFFPTTCLRLTSLLTGDRNDPSPALSEQPTAGDEK